MVLIQDLETGNYQVRYKLPNYLSESFKINVTEGLSATYQRLLTPSHNVTLKLSEPSDGTPLSDTTVTLVTLEPTITIQTQCTDTKGEVTFEDVASRTYLIQLT